MQPIIKSKIICPTCMAVGCERDYIKSNLFIINKKCSTCSGDGYLTRPEQLLGLEISFPIIDNRKGAVLAKPDGDKPIQITEELVRILLNGQAYICAEFSEWSFALLRDGKPIGLLITYEQILYEIHKQNEEIPMNRLQEAGEAYFRDYPVGSNNPPHGCNIVDEDSTIYWMLEKYLKEYC